MLMSRERFPAGPAYAVAFLLVFFPLLDTALSVWPLKPGDVLWRFGAVGLLSRSLMTPILGLLVAFSVAYLREQPRVVRTLSVLSGVTAIAIVLATGVFILDALQMRVQVQPGARSGFDMATAAALVKYALGALVLMGFAVAAWRASGRVALDQRRERGTDRVLVSARPRVDAPDSVQS